MNVLLVTENEPLYRQTTILVGNRAVVKRSSFEALPDTLMEEKVSFVILDFDFTKVQTEDYQAIIQVNSKQKVPILALMEGSCICDNFEVLNLGALDYLEKPMTEQEYINKIDCMFNWYRYYERRKKETCEEVLHRHQGIKFSNKTN